MPSYKLYYFNSKGRAELTRWLFEVGGVAYEDVRLDKDEWAKMKPNTPFGQMPILEVDGVKLCQSNTIARLVAGVTGLAGKNDMEQARANMIVDCVEDMNMALIKMFFMADQDAKAVAMTKWKEEDEARYMRYFERFLAENQTGYMVGDGFTWADCALVLSLGWAEMANPVDFKKYPTLAKLRDQVTAHPKIAAWIARRPVTEH